MLPGSVDGEITLDDVIYFITDWLIFFKSKVKWIFIVSLIGSSFGYYYAYNNKPVYVASLTFSIQEEGSKSKTLSGLASQFGYNLASDAGGIFSESNLNELLKSRLIVKKALTNPIVQNKDSFNLLQLYIKNNKINDIHFPLNTNNLSFKQDSVLDEIYKDLTSSDRLVIEQKDLAVSITTIEVKNESEIFSKLFCENLASQLLELNFKVKCEKTLRNINMLNLQIDSVRSKLDKDILEVGVLNDQTFNMNLSNSAAKTPISIKQVNVQINTSLLNQLYTNLAIAEFNLRINNDIIQVIDGPRLPLERKKVSKVGFAIKFGIISGFLMVVINVLIRFFKKVAYKYNELSN